MTEQPVITISNQEVAAQDWSATLRRDGLYGTFFAELHPRVAERIAQGHEIVCALETGEVFWRGFVSQPPETTSGPAVVRGDGGTDNPLGSLHERLLIQSRDLRHAHILQNHTMANLPDGRDPRFQIIVGNGAIEIRGQSGDGGESVVEGAGFYFWTPKAKIGRVAYHFQASGSQAGVADLSVWSVDPPDGVPVQIGAAGFTVGLGASSGDKDAIIAPADTREAIAVALKPVGWTSGESAAVTITQFRVNGINGGTDDFYQAGEFMNLLAQKAGLDGSISGAGFSLIPFDWPESKTFAEAAEYVADLFRLSHRIREGTLEVFPRGSRQSEVFRQNMLTRGLPGQRLYNRALVVYTDTVNEERTVTADAVSDPIAPGGPKSVYRVAIRDNQADEILAGQVARLFADEFSGTRYEGQLEIAQVIGGSRYLLLPGDDLRIPDWALGQAISMPIGEVAFGPGPTKVSVGSPTSPGSLLAQTALSLGKERPIFISS